MSHDKSKTGQDRKRISLTEDYERRDWAAKFGVSEETLRAAVDQVGNSPDDVEAHLGKDRQKGE